MKYVVGIARAKPGKRDDFLAAGCSQRTKQEPGCVFFELSPQMDSDDGIMVSECYLDAEALKTHNETPYMRDFVPVMQRLLAGCLLDIMISDNVEHLNVSFSESS